MKEESKLTKEWSKYNGDYEKEMQDIKLFNGDIVTMCWPNAGFWNCCRQKGNEKYYNKFDINHKDAEFTRLTHDNKWQ